MSSNDGSKQGNERQRRPLPTFAARKTFFTTKKTGNAAISIAGVPLDIATTNRAGARDGPADASRFCGSFVNSGVRWRNSIPRGTAMPVLTISGHFLRCRKWSGISRNRSFDAERMSGSGYAIRADGMSHLSAAFSVPRQCRLL